MSTLELITKEINTELEKQEIQNVLLSTTFKGLSLGNMKTAMFEGMTRGFTFKDFLEKNVYAIPFKDKYSLITSIDYARKIGMRSGICGVSIPIYVEEEGKIISCSITVKRNVEGYVGEYTSLVFFCEYSTGFNLWKSKPRTMIAKVAEMHALRKACPEEMSQVYVEEEMEKEITPTPEIASYTEEIFVIDDIETLKEYYLKNKGRGAEFDKAVSDRKKYLQGLEKKDDKNS